MNMLCRASRLSIGMLALIAPMWALGQSARPEFFVVCGSQPNQTTIYFSGVLQGPQTSFKEFQAGFLEYLTQHYGYKGAVGCLPANDAQKAENFIAARSTALRNAKKTVIDTAWTESASAQVPTPAAMTARAFGFPATSTASAQAGSANTSTAAVQKSGASSAQTGGSTQLTNVFGAIFGTGSGGGCGGSGNAAGSSKSQGSSSGASRATDGAQSGVTACQSPYQQVSTTLTDVFGKTRSDSTPSSGTAKGGQPTASDGSVGSAQSATTKLAIYGCGRQDTQVACVTELTNQNQKDTLVQASDVWKDAFIVDDRGDRHTRTNAFFLNIDGDQRQQIDISYGKSARFVLMFGDVQTKVQKVALRSANDGMDVEDISLVAVTDAAK